jgi:Fe-S oxidoreductase
MLDTAKSLLRDILFTLREPIRNGIPIVGLEPSCVSVFRDELTNLFPIDEDAKRLNKQVFMLSEFLHDHAGYAPHTLKRKALIHGHCHHKSVLSFDKETNLLKKTGLDYQVLDSGCCGMAGSFGYEADHYDVGLACGERVLLPAVRAAADDELIVSDGFSCREMIRQETDRTALHFAQVLQMALKEGPQGPRGLPEKRYEESENTPAIPVTVAGGVALLAASGIWWFSRQRRE